MFFVVDKPRLQRLIALTRDDRCKKQPRDSKGPFYRIEASGDRLKLTGQQVEAEFPATVYEPGVLFLRVTLFRQLLQTMTDMKTLAIQVNKDGMFLDNVHLSLEVGDMLLYVDPTKAPQRHPGAAAGEDSVSADLPDGDPLKGTLFEGILQKPVRRRKK